MNREADRGDGRRRRSIRRRCSFLLWESFQDGVHLLRDGRQRKLKLVLQGDKEREKETRKEVKSTEKHEGGRISHELDFMLPRSPLARR